MDNLFKKKKKHVIQKKFSARNTYLKGVGGFLLGFILILTLGFFTRQKPSLDAEELVNYNLVGSSKMYQIDTKYDPNNQLLITQYYIGDMSDIDSETDAAALTNLKYDVKSGTTKGKDTLTTRGIRVNDHFLVVITKNLEPGFSALQYQINPVPINKALGKQGAEQCVFILEEGKLKTYRNLRVETKEGYQSIYNQFLTKKYEKMLKDNDKVIKNAEAKIKANTELIAKLKDKIANADTDDTNDLQSQISDAQSDIVSQKDKISDAKKTINKVNKRLISINNASTF